MKLYLCGPMHWRPKWNFPAFDRVRDALRAAGFRVISPVDMNRAEGLTESATEEQVQRELPRLLLRDIRAVARCDGVALIEPDIVEGSGHAAEVAYARAVGKPVKHWKEWVE